MTNYSNGYKSDSEGDDVLKVRGLPWSTTVEEVVDFFKDVVDVPNGKDGVHIILSRDGRPSGEAYVEVISPDDIEKGLKKHNENMGHRYIEVFRAQRSELEWMMKRGGVLTNTEADGNVGCVRLRGLPFECSKEEIAQFFSGLQIVPNGITILTDFQGRNTGEAYVEFANKDMAGEALKKHKEKIGHRYIEIFRSSTSEVRAAQSNMRMRGGDSMSFGRPGPYDRFGPGSRGFGGPPGRGSGFRRSRPYNDYGDYGPGPGPRGGPGWGPGPMRGRFGGGTGHRVHLRGLPFRANEQDIAEFFRPLNPVNVKVIYERNGRASGEADVDFATHEEAVRAMKKDKNTMQHRYIELFLDSTPVGGMGGPGPMGYGGGGGRW